MNNKYRVIETKDRRGYAWYVPQRLSADNTWEDISPGWINKEGALERIARDITQKVVWEGTEEEVLRRMQEHQEKYENG